MSRRNALRSLVASTLAFAVAFSLVLPVFAAVPPAPPVRTVASGAAPSAVAPITPAPADTGLVIVRPKAGHSVAGVKDSDGTYVLRAPKGKSGAAYAAELVKAGDVEYAVPNYVRHVTAYTTIPNDPDFTNASNWTTTDGSVSTLVAHAKSWWARGAGSANFDGVWAELTPDGNSVAYHARATADQVKVGVIDTGYYMDHPDRGANIVVGKDCFATYNGATGKLTTDNDVTPDSPSAPLNDSMTASHGTMTAGEVAQSPDNGTGGTGAAYDTQIRIYKVQGIWVDGMPSSGYPAGCSIILDNAIIDAIRLAADDGCKVISMSLGGPDYSSAMQSAIDYAHAKGALVVAATGNEDAAAISYPARNNNVMGVGSYSLTGGNGNYPATVPARSSFSNYGLGTDIMAPGDGIWGPTVPGWDADGAGAASIPGYTWWSGTSMSTPLAAAAAALTFRFAPGLTPDEVQTVLQGSATDMGAAGYDTVNGWGKLDMAAAYAKLKSDYPNLAKPVLGGVAEGGTYASRDLTVSWAAVPGSSVQYTVSMDGVMLSTSPATDLVLTGLTDGDHNVTVTPVSPRNWNAGSTATVQFTVSAVAPVAPTVSYSAIARNITWTDTVGGTHTTQFALDGTSSPVTVTGTSKSLAAVPDGSHIAYVRMVNAGGAPGAWGSVAFVLDTTPPVTPAISWSASTRTLYWTAAEPGATVRLAIDNQSSPKTVTGTSYGLTSATADGPHTAYLLATDSAGNTGNWTSVGFTMDTVAPATPVLSWDPAERRLSWTDTESGPHNTQLVIDDQGGLAESPSVAGTSVTFPADYPLGSHTAYIRMTDAAGNVGGAGTLAFTLVSPETVTGSTATMGGTASVLAYGAKASLSGILADPGGGSLGDRTVTVEKSTDGWATWTPVLTVPVAVNGTWSASWAPGRNLSIRVRYAGDATHTATVSAPVSLRQYVYLSTPSVPSHAHHGRSFTTYGYLKPRASSGSYPVKVSFYRYEKKSGHYVWVFRKTVSAKASNYSSYTKYSVSTSLPYSGSWKAIATYAGNATYATTTSGHHDLRVY